MFSFTVDKEISIEGIKRNGQWLYDHYEDIVTYSLLAKDWQKLVK
ncbi:hypothetical protein [Metasolibacillus meyeri]|nr:hypothetical protein [Metasolibacillus meyeri]